MSILSDKQKLHAEIMRAELEAYRKLETWGASLFLGAIGLVAKQLVEWTRAADPGKRIDLPTSFFAAPALLGLLAFVFLRIVNYRGRDLGERLHILVEAPELARTRAFGWLAWFLSVMPVTLGYLISWSLASAAQSQRSLQRILLISLIVVFSVSFIVHFCRWATFRKRVRKSTLRQTQKENAEPNAPPNGGPAKRMGDSGVTGGPPSVS
jgi:hypothetical protein